MMAYLLDTNVFIEAKNRHYGFDFCPAFWKWLSSANENGTVLSIEQVRREILSRTDELAEWVAGRGDDFFVPFREPSAFAEVYFWVRESERNYRSAAIDDFTRGADGYVIAHAYATGYDVVTHEMPSNSGRKIKIPDVCAGLGVVCLTPFEMLRRERARFVLGAAT